MATAKTVYRFGKIRFTRNPRRSAWRAPLYLNGDPVGRLAADAIGAPIQVTISRKVSLERFKRYVQRSVTSEDGATYQEHEQACLARHLIRCCPEAAIWDQAKQQLYFKLKGDDLGSFRFWDGMPLTAENVRRIEAQYGDRLVRILRAEELDLTSAGAH